jgi:hypothetical protein
MTHVTAMLVCLLVNVAHLHQFVVILRSIVEIHVQESVYPHSCGVASSQEFGISSIFFRKEVRNNLIEPAQPIHD